MTKEKFDKIQTPEFRVSFPEVFVPKSYNDKSVKKYSIVMLFAKGTDFKGIQDLIRRTITKKWGAETDIPDNYIPPLTANKENNNAKPNHWIKFAKENANLIKGEIPIKDYDGYKDIVYVTASNQNTQPGLLDEQKRAIIDPKEFYAGCYAIASISAYAWSYMGKNGVSLGLQNIMKINDGEPLKTSHSPEADFENIELPDDTPAMDLGGDSIDDLGL